MFGTTFESSGNHSERSPKHPQFSEFPGVRPVRQRRRFQISSPRRLRIRRLEGTVLEGSLSPVVAPTESGLQRLELVASLLGEPPFGWSFCPFPEGNQKDNLPTGRLLFKKAEAPSLWPNVSRAHWESASELF